MPKPAQTNAGSNATAKSPTTRRFELPLLDFKFGSLTEGTNIPAPLPSPTEEVPTPPKTPVPAPEPVQKKTNGHVNGSETSPKPENISIPTYLGVKRPAEDGLASPTGSSRGSLRRLLSVSLLNKTYDEQASSSAHLPGQLQSDSRPPSRTASTITEERKSKRSSGWFRRLRHHDSDNHSVTSNSNKRMSQQFVQTTPPKPAGPPPPMIPELSALQTKVDTNIGDDIFKGIK
ncbi:hypothetical protein SLS62_003414 [Diatrype stigma]|uniref:Uncharacterized protein n=1 Tax=Diatrype stigma TaxID=117547 RepID=A0AAN9UYJ0_9PEZI